MGGTDLLRRLLEKDPGTRLIMISGFATLETAVEAMRIGAVDFLAKPFTPEQLGAAVKKAIWVKAEAEAASQGAAEPKSDERKARFDAMLREYVARPGAVVEVVRKARSIFGFLPAWALRDIASVSGKSYDQLLNLARYMAFTYVEGRPRKAEAGDLSWLEEDSYMERVLFSD
jgi:DNA-binding NarL/FixJ family response regulator